MPISATDGGYSGHQAYEYLNTGTKAAPVWVRIKRSGDVDLPDERGGSDFPIKGSDFVKHVRGPRAKTVAFKYKVKRAADPIYAELLEAFDDPDKCVEYAATDGPMATSGTTGWRGPFHVTKFSESRPIEGPVEIDVELKHADIEDPDDPGEDWNIEPITVA